MALLDCQIDANFWNPDFRARSIFIEETEFCSCTETSTTGAREVERK